MHYTNILMNLYICVYIHLFSTYKICTYFVVGFEKIIINEEEQTTHKKSKKSNKCSYEL